MDIEQAFAAQVVNAEREAAIARKYGLDCSASDVIEGGLCDLWKYDRAAAQGIADRYVVWDGSGRPQPRTVPANVVPFR